jgi:hypothetical protein
MFAFGATINWGQVAVVTALAFFFSGLWYVASKEDDMQASILLIMSYFRLAHPGTAHSLGKNSWISHFPGYPSANFGMYCDSMATMLNSQLVVTFNDVELLAMQRGQP